MDRYFRDLRDREARTLDVGRVCEPMARYALDLALAYPTATAEALTVKLMTVWPGAARPIRLLVALAAIEEANARQPLAA